MRRLLFLLMIAACAACESPEVKHYEMDAFIHSTSSQTFCLIYFTHEDHTHVMRASPEQAKAYMGRTLRVKFTTEHCLKSRKNRTEDEVRALPSVGGVD